MTNPASQPVKILQKTYHLPVLTGENLKEIQTTIQQRQSLIKTGEEEVVEQVEVEVEVLEDVIVHREEQVSGGLFGIGRKTITRKVREKRPKIQKQQRSRRVRRPLSINDRFNCLEAQIRDYDRLMALLKRHKVEYQRFFVNLSTEIQTIIGSKCQQIAAIEAERERIYQNAQQKNNRALMAMTLQQKRQVIDSLILLDKAAVLMLKKINLVSEGIDKLSRDNELSKQVLENMMAELGDYKDAIALQRQLEALQQEIAEITNVAINFEHYLQQYLGPFQDLVNDAAKVDGQLSRTVEEISRLAEELMEAKGGFFDVSGAERISESLLTLEVARIQKQSRIADALEAAQSERYFVDLRSSELSDQTVQAVSIMEQIENIKTHVDRQLTGLQGTITLQLEAEKDDELGIAPSGEGVGGGFTLPGENLSFELPNNGGTLEFIAVPGGTLTMEGGHQVTLQPFLMGKYPITQRQYQAVMGQNPSNFKGENRPVEKVNWHEARSFCQKLSEILGQQIDLPSETQWEWAARGATQSQGFEYAGSNNLDEVGWYRENSGGQTHPVGQKKPNELGLYDLSGNVCEWCQDNYTSNAKDLPRDGTAWLSSDESKFRLLRGGSWSFNARLCRSAFRDFSTPVLRFAFIGFRVVCRSSRTQ